MNMQLRCVECGKFLSVATPRVEYTLYGSPLDLDPGDPECVHLGCWQGKSEDSKRLSYRASYVKPHLVDCGCARENLPVDNLTFPSSG